LLARSLLSQALSYVALPLSRLVAPEAHGRLFFGNYVGHTIFASGARIAIQKAFSYSGPLMHLVVGTALGISIPMLLAIWGPKVGLPYLFTLSRSRQNKEVSAAKLSDA
jgi:hypothetical protein